MTVGRSRRVARRRRGHGRGKARILILIENLPLQRDARVTRQSRALLAAGYDVTVICPRSNEPMPAGLGDVRLRTYPAREGARVRDFFVEYLWASIAMTVLAIREFFSRSRFHLIQTCNPPDTLALIAAPYLLAGIPLIFDHHDLVPELFEARYSTLHPLIDRVVRRAEWLAIGLATCVLATNDSVRRVATERCGKDDRRVRVVRNGPELARVGAPASPDRAPRSDRKVAVWVGVMGGFDGVETLIEAMAVVVHELGRTDLHLVLIGDGERRDAVERLVDERDVRSFVSLLGWIPQDQVHERMREADIGVAPDPPGPRSDCATIMKVMDYMALGLPVIAFESRETRISAGDAGVFVAEHDPAAFAKAMLALLDDEEQRAVRGAAGRERIETELCWERQAEEYIDAISELVGAPAGPEERHRRG